MRFSTLVLLAFLSGCQCVPVPERQYACDGDGDGACELDAGAPDAGGTGPCDGGPCAFTDAGICRDWACVSALWGPASAPTTTVTAGYTPIPAGLDGGTYGWYGGVLLPDGRVLAVAHTADRFLVYDPRTTTVTSLGPLLSGTHRKYAGAVLAPNGRVYAFPYQARRLLEIDPLASTVTSVGPDLSTSDGGDPLYVGGVVDRFGTIWTVSEASERMPLLRFEPDTGRYKQFVQATAPWGGWWGMARLPDDRLLTFPKEYFGAPTVLSSRILVISPGPALGDAGFDEVPGFDLSDGGFGLQGGSLTREGTVCATPSGLTPDVVCVQPALPERLVAVPFPSTLSAFGFNATFGDGNVWTTPDLNDQVALISGDGAVAVKTLSGQRYGLLGLVATPQGLVGIPGGPPAQFLLIQPGVRPADGVFDRRPMPVLLSPWFNKL